MNKGLGLGLFLMGISSAWAYVPPAGFVLGHTVSQRSGLKSIEWTAKVTDLNSKSVFKEALRIDFQSGKVTAIYSSPSDEPLGSIQTSIASLHRLGKFWLGISLDPSMSRVKEALLELNVLPAEGEEAKLGRSKGKPVWFWGNESRIEFEKDEFNPISYQGGADATSDGVFFDGFAIASAKAKAPKLVRVRTQTFDTYQFELKSIKTDSPLKEKMQASTLQQAAVKEWVSLVR